MRTLIWFLRPKKFDISSQQNLVLPIRKVVSSPGYINWEVDRAEYIAIVDLSDLNYSF